MAKKFNFRLEPLLKLKTYKVNQAKDSLASALRVRYEKERLISENRASRDEVNKIKSRKLKASDIQDMIFHRNFLDREHERLNKEKSQIVEIENYRRGKLTEAMKEEKVLEKLKEKKKEIYKEELLKEETLFMDEISIQRYNYNDDRELAV